MAIPDPDGLLATILAMNEARRVDYKAGFDDGYKKGFILGKEAGLKEAKEKYEDEHAKAREVLLQSGWRA